MSSYSTFDLSQNPPTVTAPRDYNIAADFVDRRVAGGFGGKVAFIDDQDSLAYGDLQKNVSRFGNALLDLGLRGEQRVMLPQLDSLDFPIAFFGAIKAGMAADRASTDLGAADTSADDLAFWTGLPAPGYRRRLTNDNGNDVAQGEIGGLLVSGPTSAPCYWNNREKSIATFEGAWTRAGDKYIRDGDGYYVHAGRSDDMLKVGGIWVSPFEVESALMAHDSVLAAAVVGHAGQDDLIKPKTLAQFAIRMRFELSI